MQESGTLGPTLPIPGVGTSNYYVIKGLLHPKITFCHELLIVMNRYFLQPADIVQNGATVTQMRQIVE